MILRSIYLLVATLLSYVSADVQVTAPLPGDTITGLTLQIAWKDSGKAPALAQLASFQVFLCAGGNTEANYIQLATLENAGDFKDGSTLSVRLQAGWGGDVANAYFLKFVSAATGGIVVNFSDRFTLKSMTGTFPQSVQQGLRTVQGTAGPVDVNNIGAAPQAGGGAAAPPASVDQAVYNTPYTLQSGLVRYAPMPPMAQTKISAKNATPQWPTSAYTIYQTVAGPPDATTTQTLPITFKASSREATVAPAGQPTDAALQKFLNRWKD